MERKRRVGYSSYSILYMILYLFFKAVDILILILIGLIILSAVLSWLPMSGSNKYIAALHALLEPILQPIRKLVQKSIFGGANMAIDISPFIVYLILSTLHTNLNFYIVNM